MIVLSVTQFSHLVYFLELIHILCSKLLLEFSLHLHFDKFELAKVEWKILTRKFPLQQENNWNEVGTASSTKLTTLQFNVSNENEAQIPLISHFSFLFSLPISFATTTRNFFSRVFLSISFTTAYTFLLIIYLRCVPLRISTQQHFIHAKKAYFHVIWKLMKLRPCHYSMSRLF